MKLEEQEIHNVSSEDIEIFLSQIKEKTCANITNELTIRIVNCIIENKEISLFNRQEHL